jgi:hypothetical protein
MADQPDRSGTDASGATAAAADLPHDRLTLAGLLGCTPRQLGPCARCRAVTVRYGDGGNPLCRTCRRSPTA